MIKLLNYRLLIVISVVLLGGYGTKYAFSPKVDSMTPVQKNKIIFAHALLDEQGKPSALLLELLADLQVEHDGSLASIVAATQKAWLRAEGKERWEMEKKFEEKREQLVPLFKELGFVAEVKPCKTPGVPYDYVLVLGALAERVRTRLAYLKELHNESVCFDAFVFLGGARPLQAELESEAVLLNANNTDLPFKKGWKLDGALPTTETGMMRLVFEQSDLPESWQGMPNAWIDIPMLQNANGTMRRPNTGDTINGWLAQQPKPGRCLVISNQPYVAYQDAVVRTLLPENFEITTVGSASEANYSVALYLDTIARCLYQEHKRLSA